MNIKKETLKKGFVHSLHITWELSKVMVPAFVAVTFLKHTPIFVLLASWAQPVMERIGLPGEAAMPITVGIFFNQYVAIGALSAMKLSPKEVTLIALILGICHEILLESAIAKKVGIAIFPFVITRFVFAFLGALTLNAIWTFI